jgi:hypothetical protein
MYTYKINMAAITGKLIENALLYFVKIVCRAVYRIVQNIKNVTDSLGFRQSQLIF